MKTEREQVTEANDRAHELQTNFLTEHGWQHTSGTPASCWLWQKLLPDGRSMLTDAANALAIEDALAAQISNQQSPINNLP